MIQGFFDLLSNVGQPVLLSLGVAVLALVVGGALFLLLSGGVHFVGFHPPDPAKFPNGSRNLRRIGIVLLILGLSTGLTTAFMAWWDAGSVGRLSVDLRASRAELEKLSQEADAQESEIAALSQKIIQERNQRQKIESQKQPFAAMPATTSSAYSSRLQQVGHLTLELVQTVRPANYRERG